MKKLIFCLFALNSCNKEQVNILQVITTSTDIVINKDTIVNNTWVIPANTIVRFEGKGHLSGTGTLQGGIIQAALTQHIFDTTFNIAGSKLYGQDFSVMWYGAKSSNADNHNQLQKSINTCLANGFKNCFVPSGFYNYSKPLKIFNLYKGIYVGAAIHLYGESNYWDDKTTLNYTGATGFALGIQYGKGSEIDHLKISGKFLSPVITGPAYYNIPFESYGNNTGTSGLVIDYDGSMNKGGSTGISIHDLWVTGFEILYSISPNAVTFNADILLFQNIRCGNGRVGFQTGQAQEKGNVIRGIYSWDNIHTLIRIGQAGKAQAGNYTIDGGNIAGGCIRLFDIKESGWFASSISNIFSESIGSIGSITAGSSQNELSTAIKSCMFDFAYKSKAGTQRLLYCNSYFIHFQDCTFRYYGTSDTLNMHGWGTFENCWFSGKINNPYNGFVFE